MSLFSLKTYITELFVSFCSLLCIYFQIEDVS